MSQKITSYQGREITPDEVKQGKYLDIVYKFEPKYSWAAGVAISRFLTELKDGKIVARKCHKCERILVLPRRHGRATAQNPNPSRSRRYGWREPRDGNTPQPWRGRTVKNLYRNEGPGSLEETGRETRSYHGHPIFQTDRELE